MRRSLVVLCAFSLAAFVAASCSKGDEDTGGGSWKPCPTSSVPLPHPTGATDVVVRLSWGGGFPPPSFMPDELPNITIYGDGRLLAIDPNSTGQLVPSLVERRLTEDELQQVLSGAESTCLVDQDARLDLPEVYDVGGFIYTVDTGSGPHTTFAVGLGWSEMDANVPPEQEAQRSALLDFHDRVSALLAPPPGGDVVPLTPVETDRLGVFFTKAGTPSYPDWPTVEWPLGVSLADFGQDSPEAWPEVHCAIATGQDAETLLSTVEGMPSDQSPYWQDGDTLYQLELRPMLPDETDCAALVA